MSEKPALALRKSEIDDLVAAGEKDMHKVISIMRDHLMGTVPLEDEVFYLLCETISGINVVGKVVDRLLSPENEIEEGHYSVTKQVAMLLSSNLTLLKASKAALLNQGISLEEM